MQFINQELIKSQILFPNVFFDVAKRTLDPSDSSFDIIHHHFLPQSFIDFLRQLQQKQELSIINPNENEIHFDGFQKFHDKVIQLLISFTLNFSKNGIVDESSLKSHSLIVRQDLLLDLLLDENSSDSLNEFNFYDNFDITQSKLQASFKPAIFIFNVANSLAIRIVDNDSLENAPIILVYSKRKGMVLTPSSFFYYSKIHSMPVDYDDPPLNLFPLYEYDLIDDHWIPRTSQENINRIIQYLQKESKHNEPNIRKIMQIEMRSDHLSVDFKHLIEYLKFPVVGLIGNLPDILNRLGLELKDKLKQYIDTLSKPVIFFYPKEIENQNNPKEKISAAYMFFYCPWLRQKFCGYYSPSHPSFIEATADAEMKLRSLCSNVVVMPSKINSVKLEQLTPRILHSRTFQNNEYPFLLGSYDTTNLVVINKQKENKEKTIHFKSIEHLRQWLNWSQRIYKIGDTIDRFKPFLIQNTELSFTFTTNEFQQIRFSARNEYVKASCRLSKQIYEMIKTHYFQLKEGDSENLDTLTIKSITAFEDGRIDLRIESMNSIDTLTYTFFRFKQSKTKLLMPLYTDEIATLRNIHSSFHLMNSYSLDDGVLLVLFYSEIEQKVLVTILRNKYDDQIIPDAIFEIESDYSECGSLKFHTAFNLKTRTLIFVVRQNHVNYLVKMVIPLSYVKIEDIRDVIIYQLTQFYPIDISDVNKVEFNGFIINEDGNDAVMILNGPMNISITPQESNNRTKHKKSDNQIQPITGTYNFLVYFNPSNLERLKTIRIKNLDIESPNLYPFLYMNNILAMFHCDPRKGLARCRCSLILKLDVKNTQTNQYNIEENYKFQKTCLPCNFDCSEYENDIVFLKHMFNVIDNNNMPEILLLEKSRNCINLIFKKFYNDSDEDTQKANDGNQTEKKEASVKQSLMSFFSNSRPAPSINTSELVTFNYNSIQKLIHYRYYKYGVSIVQQTAFPRPECYPYHLSIINLAPLGENTTSDEKLLDIVSTMQGFKSMTFLEFDETEIENFKNVLHKSPGIFVYSLLSPVEIVVDNPIVDSATSAILSSNFNRLKTTKSILKSMSNLKSISHLCYTLRVNKFPNFPFLRMTTKCPSFHIAVISENGSSLLSWLTGIGFSCLPKNTLAIGSTPIPCLSRGTKWVDDKSKIIPKAINTIVNVVGSLFTVNETSFNRVVGFIVALVSCNLVVLDFTTPANVLEFFEKFLECADLVADQFHLQLSSGGNSKIGFNLNLKKPVLHPVKCAIFCENGTDQTIIDRLNADLVKMLAQRELGTKNSFVAQFIRTTELVIMSQSQSAEDKAIRLKNMNFVNCTDAWRSTNDLMSLLCEMSAIYGQQIDYEANGGFRGFAKESTNGTNGMIPFVHKDQDDNQSQMLFSLAEQIDNQMIAKELYKRAAFHFGDKEALKWILDQDIDPSLTKKAKDLWELLGYNES